MNLSGNMKEFIWKKYGEVKNLYRNVRDLLRNIYIYGKMMNLTEQVKEFVWQKYGKVKNLYGNVKDL